MTAATLKVTLLDYTGKDSGDALYAVKKLIRAKSTRLGKGVDIDAKIAAMTPDDLRTELEYIANTIRSSWEFIGYTFKIEGVSRACCDQIVRTRVGVSFAVMAMRVVDQSDFSYVVPETIAADPGLRAVFEGHMKVVAATYEMMTKVGGIPAQDARAIIPMAAESPLTAQYNLRSLVDVVGKRENLRAQGEYQNVAREMKRLVLEVHPWALPFLEPDRTATPRLDQLLREQLGNAGPLDKPHLNEALKELDKLKGVWG